MRGPVFRLCLLAGPGESSTAPPRLQSGAVPELPDLTVVGEAFHAALAGRPIASRRCARAAGRPGHAGRAGGARRASGSWRVRRRGKFLILDLDRDRIVVNPMLTGRFQLAAAEGQAAARRRPSCWRFGPRERAAGRRGAVDARRRVAARGRRLARGPLPRPDADGQGLPAAGGRGPRDPGRRPGRLRARSRRSRADARRLARSASDDIRAS